MSSNILGRKVARIALEKKGCKTGDKDHKQIVDAFNKVHPHGQIATYKSFWCAIFWTYAQIMAGIPQEETAMGYNVPQLLEEAKKKGIFIESDKHIPRVGDGVLYDWDDDGRGDNKGIPDHIGTCFKVTKTEIHVIEGNTSKRNKEGKVVDTGVCAVRVININGVNIRGFICPKYNAILLNKNAIKISYPVGTKVKVYKKRPNKAYRVAWKKFYPKKHMTIACHIGIMLLLRMCGYRTMPLNWKKIPKYMDERFDRVKCTHKDSNWKAGDIGMYRRIDSKGKEYHHIWAMVKIDGQLYMVEASQPKHYAMHKRSTSKANKQYTKTWIWRAKER